MDQTDKEMNDMLLEEQVDPVSGNTAPVGALPSEVRDDITVNVSPNEFVIPAYTLRYFGEDFFNELLGAAEQGWDRIKAGEEPMPPKSESDTEAVKDGYDEGGAIPGEDVDVPPPVGGGYGQYGGTGATFGGFEFKTFINPETEQEIRIYFFNGKPLSRIPEGFREKGATAVEEQEQVAEEQTRDDDDTSITAETARENAPNWTKTKVEDWTMDDYNDYAESMKTGNTTAGGFIENSILTLVGSVIGGPAGAAALPLLARKAKEKQAANVNTNINNILKSGKTSEDSDLTNDDMNILFKAQFEANSVSDRDPSLISKLTGIGDDRGQSVGVPIYEQAFYQKDDGSLDIDALLPSSSTEKTSSGILEKTATITKTVEDENARVAAIEAEKARREVEKAERKLKEAADLAEAIPRAGT